MDRSPLRAGLAAVLLLFSAVPLAAQDTWVPLNTGTTQDLHAIHFVSADVGYAAGGGGTVIKTTDGGATWADVSPPINRDFYGVYFFDANEGVVVGSQGAIGRTLDGGATWSNVPSGTNQTIHSVAFAGDVGLAGAGSQTILRSSNRGASWSVVQSGFFGGGFYGADMVSPAVGFVAGQNSIFQPLFGATDDGGQTFDFTAFYLNNNEGQLEATRFLDAQNGFAVGRTFDFNGAISRTSDGGQTWTTVLFTDALYGVDFADGETGYAAGDNGSLLRTVNGGGSWSPVQSGTTATLYAVSIPTTSTGYVAGSGGTVLKGTFPSGAPLTLVVTPVDPPVEVSPGESFQFTVTLTNTGGAPLTFDVWAEAVQANTGLSVTFGRRTLTLAAGASLEATLTQRVPLQAPAGAYVFTVNAGEFPDEILASDGFPVTVLGSEAGPLVPDGWDLSFGPFEAHGTTAPTAFALEAAAPNPAGAQAVIRYSLPEAAQVTLRVYDALGREVAVLVDGVREAGRHEVAFDAARLSAGTYLYRLEAGAFAATRMLTLAK